MTYLAFVLDDKSRAELLRTIPARYAKVIAHHVTLVFPKNPAERLAAEGWMLEDFVKKAPEVEVFAEHYDGRVQAAAVKVGGQYKRAFGGYHHVTVSLIPPAKPADSNDMLEYTIAHAHFKPFKLTGTFQLCN